MRIDIPSEKKLVYEMTMPIRWGDMDAMGHVNNTVYFRYLEIVRIEWLRAIGAGLNPQGHGPIIVNAFCNFIRQLEYPGDILAKQYVTPASRSSFDIWVMLERCDQPGVLYATGGATTVWIDFPQGKSVPLPDWVRRHLD